MGKICCELCGGDIIKENDVFVCQKCGCKYSKDEVKKMIGVTGDNASNEGAANQTQLSNLIKLAKAALDGKNLTEAERLANQALTIKADCYEALIIKARSIYYQADETKSRMLEAFNCYMLAFESLDEASKGLKRDELYSEIIHALEIETSFWVDLIKSKRPSETTVSNAKKVFSEALSMVQTAGDKLGINPKNAKVSLTNGFIDKVSATAYSTWREVVGYNYFRESLRDCGEHWKLYGRDITEEFRPSDDTFQTFNEETDQLVDIMSFAVALVNSETDLEVAEALCSNMAFYLQLARNSVSFDRYEHMSPYDCYHYYEVRHYWNSEAKARMDKQIAKWSNERDKYERLAKEQKAKLAAEKKAKEAAEAKARFDAYWAEHKAEKEELEREKAALFEQKTSLKSDIEKVPGKDLIDNLQRKIDALRKEKSELGLFKFKEKKELEQKMTIELARLFDAKKKREEEVAPLQSKLNQIEKRIANIINELAKDR